MATIRNAGIATSWFLAGGAFGAICGFAIALVLAVIISNIAYAFIQTFSPESIPAVQQFGITLRYICYIMGIAIGLIWGGVYCALDGVYWDLKKD